MATITISDLHVNAVIGTLPAERTRRQQLILTVEFDYDAAAAAANDDLFASVDYSAVEKFVVQCVEKSSYFLLEALAAAVGRCILTFPQISSCVVRIAKPGASSCGALISYQAEFHQESSRHEQ